ncbi:hypothetical protein EEJ42_34670 [Streptomyces botrytidirepellens]|uniref:Uncharacterized protein n=1 Tax=Streptomyces botrytidirepellens TaxID=2486417 RepID=A0A3M8UDG6_9ACTN|nr:hypothetical protein EEJ42_34670 [Streptomyces botrytidirepellens]
MVRPEGLVGGAPDPRSPGGADVRHVVGNRSAEGAPPSGSWGRNGWAQPTHRPAPGDETSRGNAPPGAWARGCALGRRPARGPGPRPGFGKGRGGG